MTTCGKKVSGRDSIQALVARSSKTTKRVNSSQRRRLGTIMRRGRRRSAGRKNRAVGSRFASRDSGVSCFDFSNGLAATLANGGVTLIFADVDRVVPAADAFLAVGALDADFQAGNDVGFEFAGAGVHQLHLRDDEQSRELDKMLLELGL